jgi:hypothetical protein
MPGSKRIRKHICAFILVQMVLGSIIPFVGTSLAVADSNPLAADPPAQAPPMPSDTTGYDTLSVGSGGTGGETSVVDWILEAILGLL